MSSHLMGMSNRVVIGPACYEQALFMSRHPALGGMLNLSLEHGSQG